MPSLRRFGPFPAAALLLCRAAFGGQSGSGAQPPAVAQTTAIEKWTVTVGKSLVLDSPLPIERVSVADGNLADAVAVNPREVLINGKLPGETSLIIWQNNGSRTIYDLSVQVSPLKLQAVREQIASEFPGEDISVAVDNDAAFVRGSVKDLIAAGRVIAIASTLGKTVNLLRVEAPAAETQILVKVRFANVDRSAAMNLGFDLASGAFNQSTAAGTDSIISSDGAKTFTVSEAVNVLLFRKDLNLVAALQALQSKNLLEMLAEPTVPAMNGKQASFVAGGEFPFPMVQPSVGGAVVTLSWREYGVRLSFLPVITPRGGIRLQVAPEVSSLDYTHAVTVQGYTIPALAKRRVQTEIELESGQSFVIAGLIDNEITDNLAKVPGIGSIPILGKLFQSKTVSRSNSELLVIVTPEIVRPIPEGQQPPELNYPRSFMDSNSKTDLREPGVDKTGPVPATLPEMTMPVEQLRELQKAEQQMQQQGSPAAAPAAPPQAAPAPDSGGSGGTLK
ncbi:MAG: pilus assembly protein N-terminal domain-containing protein [Bryobacteraceae bacterium]|jgi:pilus assembly protein CpaC